MPIIQVIGVLYQMSKIQIADLSSKSILKDLNAQDIQRIFGGRQIEPEPDPQPPSSCWGGECRNR
jgi:hypothetical protein